MPLQGPEPTVLLPISFQYTPIEALRNLFVGFLQGLFHAAPPGAYHWEEDFQVTEIVIQDEAPVKEEVLQKRPLLTLTRGPVQFFSFGMDDLLQYDSDINRKTKSILVPGTMTVNCCSRVSLEAERLGWIVAEHIWLLRDLLISAGLFDAGRQIVLGAPSPAGSIIADDNGDGWIVVAVNVPFQFVRTSSVMPLGQEIVQSIQQRFALGPLPVQSPVGPPPVDGHELPAAVTPCPAPSLLPSPISGATGHIKQPFLPKQRHPLDPTRDVYVRTVRPFRPGVTNPTGHQGAVPIPLPCVKQST